MAQDRQTIAVFFGGRSPEHDVSVVSALQAIDALDPELYEIVPVYIAGDGAMFTGSQLLSRESYIPGPAARQELAEVRLDLTPRARGCLAVVGGSLFRRAKDIEFDVAIPAFHGLFGEDGRIQGAFEMADIAYTGMRAFASMVLMDKVATKRILSDSGVPLLPFREIRRPAHGLMIAPEDLARSVEGLAFPLCVKPAHLGSSIGVARVETHEELAAVLPGIFRYDDLAIVEPFVENMVEYNVAVMRRGGETRFSAIEKPKRAEELLDFRQKYLSGSKDGGKSAGAGSKQPGQISQGMLSLTRELNPSLPEEAERNIHAWAAKTFEIVSGSGAPRFDFIANEASGEIWLNEVNPCPGSFGYFLWEAAAEPLLFAELLDHLIAEAGELRARGELPADPTPEDARLFPRRG